ncbi:hypothetical protein [Tenacibaculum jejuense]|uniref:Uncharacterized protein n=1 Tax=Tenacibaculum jejuense TaxID=584609 RepID=A0A238U4S1_9FLAO|nr:hypothetical protein [Tenacibaculum jejuense]SNR14199.1 protein of unknown function [Tenacibaculum jejuense]
MIISENSFIRKPPKILLPRQIPVFDAITCSVDICEISYKNLKEKLNKFSNKPNPKGLVFQELYLEIWSIFNNLTIFSNLLNEHFGIEKNNPLFENFYEVRQLRNTIAHIEKRITEILIEKEFPIYGVISWTKNIKNTNDSKLFAVSTGTFTDKNKMNGKILGVNSKFKEKEIYNICYTGIIRNLDNTFQEVSVNIDEIIQQLKGIIEHLESQINIKKSEERHLTNLFIEIDGSWK